MKIGSRIKFRIGDLVTRELEKTGKNKYVARERVGHKFGPWHDIDYTDKEVEGLEK